MAAAGRPRTSDDVALSLGSRIWTGWTSVRVTRGIERFPSDFELGLTEGFPNDPGVLMLEPGTAATVQIGQDLVITGAVDRYLPSIGPGQHNVRIQGRSRCSDLIDSAAGLSQDLTWTTQFASGPILATVQQLAQPFGITVTSTSAAAQKVAPMLNLNLGETSAELIDRVCRWAALLYYDDTAGNLVLADVGSQIMASGFQEGVNVESAAATFSADQRFSAYVAVWTTNEWLSQEFEAFVPNAIDGNLRAIVKDDSLPPLRFRPHVIVSEQVSQGADFGELRATWEMNRCNGRSRAVTLTTDTWRDSAGTLWTPNAIVPVNIPSLKITNERWLIGEVTYRRDPETGTHADLVLMPPQAYQPEPFNLQPVNRPVADALGGGAQKDNPAATAAGNPAGNSKAYGPS